MAFAVTLGGVGMLLWRTTSYTVPVPPLPPQVFAAVPVSGVWTPTTTAVQTALLEVVHSFNIKVASFRTESRAAALAAELETAGFPGFTSRQGSEWHVVAGPYLSEAQTVGVRERLAVQFPTANSQLPSERQPWEVGIGNWALGGGFPPAAGDARFVRAVVLRSADRTSLALELTAEPQKAVLRALSAAVLEVEAGPLSAPVRELELEPASGVPVVRHVSIREYRAAGRGAFVRARLVLHRPGRGNIRIVGRVVYVDLAERASPVEGAGRALAR